MTIVRTHNILSLTTSPGLPAMVNRLASVRALSGLAGLYMFEDGTVGGAYPTAKDVSGLGNNATLRAASLGFATPVVTAAGLSLPVGDSTHKGVVYDTPIARSDAAAGYTLLFLYKNDIPQPTSGAIDYVGVVGNSVNQSGNNAYVSTTDAGLWFGKRIQNNTASGNIDEMNIFDFKNTFMSTQYLPQTALGAITDAQGYSICGLSFDVSGKTVSTFRNSAVINDAVALKSGWSAVSIPGYFCFGNFLNAEIGGASAFAPAGQLAAVVICTQPNTKATILAAMANLKTVANKRGIALSS